MMNIDNQFDLNGLSPAAKRRIKKNRIKWRLARLVRERMTEKQIADEEERLKIEIAEFLARRDAEAGNDREAA